MSWLQSPLGNRNTLLQQWKKYEVIKKNSSRGVKHGPSGRQKMYYQARQMLKKTRQAKHGRHQRYFHVGMPKKITESHCQP